MSTPEPDSMALSLSHHFHTTLDQQAGQFERAEQSSKVSKEKHPEVLHQTQCSPASLPSMNYLPPQDLETPGSSKNSDGWTALLVSKSFPQYLSKEMVRGFTVGLSKDEFENILYKAETVECPSQASNNDPQAASTNPNPRYHPKAILLGILEDFETCQRDQIKRHESFIEIIEDDIEIQRRPSNKDGNGLVRCSIKLSQENLYLGRLRPKFQYLTSAIAALESCSGIPQSIEELAFLFPQKSIGEKAAAEWENYFGMFWTHQLGEINSRLSHMKGKGEQCKLDVETLQHRVTGDLLMVSTLDHTTMRVTY
jgi:hypothetical protein